MKIIVNTQTIFNIKKTKENPVCFFKINFANLNLLLKMSICMKIYHDLCDGKNVLMTGYAGCGKSYTVKEVVKLFFENRRKKKIACTSTTGISALNLNIPELKFYASTLHRWGGIGDGEKNAEGLLGMVKSRPYNVKVWEEIDILIIDEISMMGKELFDKLDYIARSIRKNTNPFGGITLLVVGDFLQLPPVNQRWCFESKVWNDLKFVPYFLKKCKRFQDKSFFAMLKRISVGKPHESDIAMLEIRQEIYERYLEKKKLNQKDRVFEIEPTILYSKKIDVEAFNISKLKEIDSEEIIFPSNNQFIAKNKNSKIDFYLPLLENIIPNTVVLKIGAQVMLKKNLDISLGYANGSRGVVVDIGNDLMGKYVSVKFLNNTTIKIRSETWEIEDNFGLAKRTQIPLILASACTIHKSQGCTLDYVVCHLGSDIFANGQAYVALSRVRDISGLFVSNFHPSSIKADFNALKFMDSIGCLYKKEFVYPIIIFRENLKSQNSPIPKDFDINGFFKSALENSLGETTRDILKNEFKKLPKKLQTFDPLSSSIIKKFEKFCMDEEYFECCVCSSVNWNDNMETCSYCNDYFCTKHSSYNVGCEYDEERMCKNCWENTPEDERKYCDEKNCDCDNRKNKRAQVDNKALSFEKVSNQKISNIENFIDPDELKLPKKRFFS